MLQHLAKKAGGPASTPPGAAPADAGEASRSAWPGRGSLGSWAARAWRWRTRPCGRRRGRAGGSPEATQSPADSSRWAAWAAPSAAARAAWAARAACSSRGWTRAGPAAHERAALRRLGIAAYSSRVLAASVPAPEVRRAASAQVKARTKRDEPLPPMPPAAPRRGASASPGQPTPSGHLACQDASAWERARTTTSPSAAPMPALGACAAALGLRGR